MTFSMNWTQKCALRSLSERTGWEYGWDIAARNTLESLVRRGLAEMRTISLDTEYRITQAGREWLEENPVRYFDDD
jgi:hypothetical protein